jgi:predicted transcriptional regulator
MKHEEVVAALKVIADKGLAKGISAEDLESLKGYNLVDIITDAKTKKTTYTLTKKGRVMLKANSKDK